MSNIKSRPPTGQPPTDTAQVPAQTNRQTPRAPASPRAAAPRDSLAPPPSYERANNIGAWRRPQNPPGYSAAPPAAAARPSASAAVPRAVLQAPVATNVTQQHVRFALPQAASPAAGAAAASGVAQPQTRFMSKLNLTYFTAADAPISSDGDVAFTPYQPKPNPSKRDQAKQDKLEMLWSKNMEGYPFPGNAKAVLKEEQRYWGRDFYGHV